MNTLDDNEEFGMKGKKIIKKKNKSLSSETASHFSKKKGIIKAPLKSARLKSKSPPPEKITMRVKSKSPPPQVTPPPRVTS